MIHLSEITGFETVIHNTDLCVVGGGLAGLFAAVSAARHGSRVVLMHDRPVLGGNASSEIRMWIRGARDSKGGYSENNKETGLLEEISLENIYRNPDLNYSIWDSVLYELAINEPNLELLLNCSCNSAEMDGDKIVFVSGWQTTTQKNHRVYAKIFADCSGDSVLAPITGAEFRMGRESSKEFNEDIAPAESDNCTMGMSCLFQARETSKPSKFIPPKFANKYTKDDFPFRLDVNNSNAWKTDNYWWMELGGVYDSIGDTEKMRDELLKVAFGVWDFIKNSGCCDADNWELEWLGFLPGKRESRRYVGDYIMTQHDVRAEGRFDDLIAYGGWSMDDHHPSGFETREQPTIYHSAPSPYGIPYRCIYSKNISNLMFAGRNISVTHSAVSSSRVMSTCGILGQALGTAAALAIEKETSPRGVYEKYIHELKQRLMRDDCYLPFNRYIVSELTSKAKISGCDNVSKLINGYRRTIQGVDNAAVCELGQKIKIELPEKAYVNTFRIIFDSDLERKSYNGMKWYLKEFPMKVNVYLDAQPVFIPKTIVRDFDIEVDFGNGKWEKFYSCQNNYQRLVNIKIEKEIKSIRFTPISTHGADNARIYEIEII